MLKIRISIIYIMVFAIVSGSVGPEMLALADQNPPGGNTVLVVDTPALEQATEKLSTSAETFYVSEESNAAIDKSLETKPTKEEEEKAEEDQAGSKWMSIQAMLTSFVMLAIASVHQKAHEQNLQLTPENEKALVENLAGLAPTFVSYGLHIPILYGTYRVTEYLSPKFMKVANPFFKSETGQNLTRYLPFFKAAAAQRLFKYFVSSGLLSIGLGYVRGFLLFAAQEVIDHPTRFGGLTQPQLAALKALQTPLGFAHFLSSLVYNPDTSPKNTREDQVKIFAQINWKVIDAMGVIMVHGGLLEALYSHLFREAFLQGQNGYIVGFSVVTEIITQMVEMMSVESIGPKGLDKKALIISVATGLIGGFFPDKYKDWGTGQANSNYATLERRYESTKINWEISHLDTNATSEEVNKNLTSIFKDEKSSRENRFVKYAYLMKLAADRIDAVRADKAKILYNQTAEGKAAFIKPTGLTHLSIYYFFQVMGGDIFTTDEKAIAKDDENILFYENFFKKASSKMMGIYADSANTFKQFDTINLPPSGKLRVGWQQHDFEQMVIFINYLSQTLSQQWDLPTPQASYYPARTLLEQISFWGINESDILQIIGSGAIVNH